MKDMLFISLIFAINSITINKFPKRSKSSFTSTEFLQEDTAIFATCLDGYKPETATGIAVPIRLNRNFDVECLSLNGKDCLWNQARTPQDCFDLMLKYEGKIQPLTCGIAHKAIYGIEGYGKADHWCEIGRQWFFNTWHCSDETNIPTGIKIDWETKNVECLSQDGKECVWNDVKTCHRAKDSKRKCAFTKPLICGSANAMYFNNTNPYYDANTNWCKSANAYFFGSTNWVCGGDKLGYDIPFRYNEDGDIECFALNSKDCAWGMGTGKNCTDYVTANINNVNPLVCGAMHNSVFGGDVYSNSNHWCRKIMDAFVLTSRKK